MLLELHFAGQGREGHLTQHHGVRHRRRRCHHRRCRHGDRNVKWLVLLQLFRFFHCRRIVPPRTRRSRDAAPRTELPRGFRQCRWMRCLGLHDGLLRHDRSRTAQEQGRWLGAQRAAIVRRQSHQLRDGYQSARGRRLPQRLHALPAQVRTCLQQRGWLLAVFVRHASAHQRQRGRAAERQWPGVTVRAQRIDHHARSR
ncbi:hypothetical protein D9M72_382160 [compost metagenome]